MKNKLAVLIISLMMLLTSCVNNSSAPPKRTYISTDVTYSEPTAQFSFRLNLDSTETESAKYFFEASINSTERNACIDATEKILSNQALAGVVPEIYIFSKNRYDSKFVSDHKLYSTVQNWTSVEYITDILLTAYGESAHYGTAFGYANYLVKSYQWSSNNSGFSTPSVHDIFDLNYLCFNENFATSNDITAAKEISCDFALSYIKQYGEQALQQLLLSHSKSLAALTSYYEKNGVSYVPSAIQYGYGGQSCDYIVYSGYCTFYIENDWVDTNAECNPLITDGFLHSNYADTKAFFETNLEQMKQYQNLFHLNDYNNDLDIVFTKPISVSKYSFYQKGNHRIYVYNVDSLMHEYIHSLTMPATSMESWQVEGFARYFSYYYDSYGIAFLNQDYNNAPNTTATKYVHEYLAAINRPIDMAKDYRELENIAVYCFGFTNPNTNYVAGSSFVQYLVKQYGEEAVIQFIYGTRNPLPKAYADLVREWNAFIETNYQNYSKYK